MAGLVPAIFVSSAGMPGTGLGMTGGVEIVTPPVAHLRA